MSIGKQLKELRERRHLTQSEVAAGTRMKQQVVDALEKDEFERLAAPFYVKGFIKLYAEFLGLDAQRLVDEYTNKPAAPAVVEKEKSRHKPEKRKAFSFKQSTAGEEMELFEKPESAPPRAPAKKEMPLPAALKRAASGAREKSRGAVSGVGSVAGRLRKAGLQALNRTEALLVHAGNAARLRLLPLLTSVSPHARRYAAALAAALLLVLTVSAVSRCLRSRSSGELTALPENDAPGLAVEPPSPYFDEPLKP